MSDVRLSDQFFMQAAGWEAMKQARSLLERGNVLSSNWTAPVLKGVVQEGSISYRSGMVIKGESDIENLCSCRQSRESGTICAHAVAVGLHHLKRSLPAAVEKQVGGGESGRGRTAAAGAPKLKRSDAGEPVELFFVLPPNMGPALERGRVMLMVEAKWARGRVPINSLPLATAWKFSPEDLVALEILEEITKGEPPGMIHLTAAELARLLGKLVEHPRVGVGRSTALVVKREPHRLAIRATLEKDGQISVGRGHGWQPSSPGQGELLQQTETGAARGRQGTHLPGRDARPMDLVLVRGETTWSLSGQTFRPLGLPAGFSDLLTKPVVIPRSRVPLFLMQDWARLVAGCDVEADFRLEDFELEPQPPKFLLNLAGGIAQLTAQLQCVYGQRIMTVGATDPNELHWLPDPDNPKRYSTRDLAAEQGALSRLTKYGFRPGKTAGTYDLMGQGPVLTFFAREFPKLEKEWKVTLEERLERSAANNLERIEPKFQVTPSGVQWFDLDVSFGTKGGERFSQADIQRLLLGGQSHTKLRNGKFALIDTGAVEELQEVLLDCNPQQTGQGYRMSATQAGFLDATLAQNGWQASAPQAWKERAKVLSGEATLECPPLGSLEEVLRPYQKHGVGWMRFLRTNGFGGVLADEMGLGKTLQALAFLSSVGRASLRGQEDLLQQPEIEAARVRQNSNLPGRDARPTDVGRASPPGQEDLLQQPGIEAARVRQNSNLPGRYARPTGAIPFKAFDPSQPIVRHTRHLPHWEQDGATYFVTFRLADSVPMEKARDWHDQRREWMRRNPRPWNTAQENEYSELFSELFERWLDLGSGEKWLARPEVADLVEGALRHFDGERYQLGGFVIMPNHVHLLVKPLMGHRLQDILQSWKSYTAQIANKGLGRSGGFWQEEYFDTLVGDEDALTRFSRYIDENPAKAGLQDGFRLGAGSGALPVGRASSPGQEALLRRPEVEAAEGRQNTNLPGRDARPTEHRPHLVVCPTSLVFNWVAEAARFTSGLKVVALHGPDRHGRFGDAATADLVVTSYALIRRDAEKYRALEFDTVVLDEAQHIKNRQTQNAQAGKAIRSSHRLVLTGTPMENSVFDLWSIFDFLMPGYLGTAQDFKERYEQPISREKNSEAQGRLARRLKPFLLRRLKREVAKELPEKIEQVSFCELTEEQAQVYKQVLDATRREVVMAVDQQGLAKSRMMVLSALLRLRQICCDLRLLPVGRASSPGQGETETENREQTRSTDLPGRDARPTAPSGKLEMFSELLEEIVDGGHRVLVFSQFVGMLSLLKERLAEEEIEYCYLDGSTTDRGAVVESFQRGKAPVFLISLKAGGVGLNLTGADTVVHFDPWWNPAVEDQATDRAHRIGQSRVVTSYKLITRGTIEEKILQLQAKKREVIAATLTGEEAFTNALNWEEIQELLA